MAEGLKEDELQWMRELNAEAVRRRLDPQRWPMDDAVVSGGNCWSEDYRAGRTPAQALDASGWRSFISYTDAERLADFAVLFEAFLRDVVADRAECGDLAKFYSKQRAEHVADEIRRLANALGIPPVVAHDVMQSEIETP